MNNNQKIYLENGIDVLLRNGLPLMDLLYMRILTLYSQKLIFYWRILMKTVMTRTRRPGFLKKLLKAQMK